jgi:lipid-A-disaccharide synthase
MRRLVDHVLCKLPFEAEWYRSHHCHAEYVGHPYFDQLAGESLDQEFIAELRAQPGPLVTILPGSRTQEVLKNLQWFLKAAQRVLDQLPNVRFAIASFNEKQAQMARETVAASSVPANVYVQRTPELIEAARCCMACSGSVSMELLYHAKPSVILYWVGWFPYTVARAWFMRVRYITLVNLLASEAPLLERGEKYDQLVASGNDVPFPEFLTYNDCSSELAAYVVDWILNDRAYACRVQELTELKAEFAVPGASDAAADYVLDVLGAIPKLAGPHFTPARPRTQQPSLPPRA